MSMRLAGTFLEKTFIKLDRKRSGRSWDLFECFIGFREDNRLSIHTMGIFHIIKIIHLRENVQPQYMSLLSNTNTYAN